MTATRLFDPAADPQLDTPEQAVARWKAENYDDPSNHPFLGQGQQCRRCGDNEAGLLHAFHTDLDLSEPIYEAQMASLG